MDESKKEIYHMKITKAQLRRIIKEELSGLDPAEPAKEVGNNLLKQKQESIEKEIMRLQQGQSAGTEIYRVVFTGVGAAELGVFTDREVAEKIARLVDMWYLHEVGYASESEDPWFPKGNKRKAQPRHPDRPNIYVQTLTLDEYTPPEHGPGSDTKFPWEK